ncbi:MAG: HEAT repeat domain-containing protein [Planctomycetota bacterium]|nr:HEAT repeat domain-containing protein [Planctomycetota bacterium]
MRNLIVAGIACSCVLAMLSGCLKNTGQPWSTKAESTSQSPIGPGRTPMSSVDQMAAVDVPEDLHDAAIDVLLRAAASTNELLRANAIEALHRAPAELEPVVRRGVVDENRGVRFVAAMTIGTLRMEQLAYLLEPLLSDESLSVRASAIFGLKRCGHRVDPTPLSAMIASDDPEVRGNAALVLGELGDPSAAPMIRQAVGKGMRRANEARVKMVNLQLAEAMVKLGLESEIEAIRAALFAPPEQGEIVALACMICGRLKDERVVANLIRLAHPRAPFQQPAEVRMAATWALARIDPTRATIDVPMEYTGIEQYQLRAQAALTLGEVADPAALPTLATMLDDPNPLVRVAAASAILQVQQP